MEDHQFDRLTRVLAKAPSRRSVVKSMIAAGVASVSGVLLARSPQAQATAVSATPLADLDPDEQAIAFYEQLTNIAHDHAAEGCDAIAEMTEQFLADHADIRAKIRAEDATWSRDQHEAYVETYGARLEEATRKAHFARERCRYTDESKGTPVASPQAAGGNGVALARSLPLGFAAGGNDAVLTRAAPLSPAATSGMAGIEAGCGGKGCADHCPLDRSECFETWGLCAAGDDCNCCLSSLCGSKSYCLTNCTGNDCCSGVPACNNASPNDGGGDDGGGGDEGGE